MNQNQHGQAHLLYDSHVAAGARMVDFGGWDMPGQLRLADRREHHAVSNDAGMFDVSHMTVVDMEGPRVTEFLRHLLANDVAKLKESPARRSTVACSTTRPASSTT